MMQRCRIVLVLLAFALSLFQGACAWLEDYRTSIIVTSDQFDEAMLASVVDSIADSNGIKKGHTQYYQDAKGRRRLQSQSLACSGMEVVIRFRDGKGLEIIQRSKSDYPEEVFDLLQTELCRRGIPSSAMKVQRLQWVAPFFR